jgi:glutaredoxin 3
MVPPDRPRESQEVDEIVPFAVIVQSTMSNDKKMVVWVSEPSVVCARVKAFLDARGYEYEAIEVDGDSVRERMLRETGKTTCPLVVVGEVIVGGFDETEAADRSGELGKLVATT